MSQRCQLRHGLWEFARDGIFAKVPAWAETVNAQHSLSALAQLVTHCKGKHATMRQPMIITVCGASCTGSVGRARCPRGDFPALSYRHNSTFLVLSPCKPGGSHRCCSEVSSEIWGGRLPAKSNLSSHMVPSGMCSSWHMS